jgi:F-type H+-transporting ATPase subunit b
LELNWSTFILEIINFLVLVWILKLLLYKPVMRVIARRRAAIQNSLAEAETLRREAELLQERYGARLADWEAEKQAAREAFQNEMNDIRRRAMQELEESLAQEREKMRILEERRIARLAHDKERDAISLGARFASRLLEGVADARLEGKLVKLFFEQLSELSAHQRGRIRATIANATIAEVTTAFELSEQHRKSLEQSLNELLARSVNFEYHTDTALIAGLRIAIGPWVLSANLADELAGFIEFADENGK